MLHTSSLGARLRSLASSWRAEKEDQEHLSKWSSLSVSMLFDSFKLYRSYATTFASK